MDEIRIKASTRSLIALYLIPFSMVWSGMSLGMLYGTQIVTREFNPFFTIFGLPFLIGSIVLFSQIMMSIAGSVIIRITDQHCRISTGFGLFRIFKKIDLSKIDRVYEEEKGFFKRSQSRIILEGNRQYKFGVHLNSKKKYYVIQALKKHL